MGKCVEFNLIKHNAKQFKIHQAVSHSMERIALKQNKSFVLLMTDIIALIKHKLIIYQEHTAGQMMVKSVQEMAYRYVISYWEFVPAKMVYFV